MGSTRRWRAMVVGMAALGVALASLTVPATAAVFDNDTKRVRNLAVSAIGNDQGRKYVDITWEKPETRFFQSIRRYRVAYWTDWRPQYSLQIITPLQQASINNLQAGREYTVVVQADSGDGWGQEATVRFRVPGGSDAPWLVSLGDSFISGEGGRWAGNISIPRNRTDTGARAYFDTLDGEAIEACHRSAAALVHIGNARSMNFACSGAITRSQILGEQWKPGIDARDFSNQVTLGPTDNAVGQTQLLETFARTHDVQAVVLSIGGNDFSFGPIVTECVKLFLRSVEGGCRNSTLVQGSLGAFAQTQVQRNVEAALLRIAQAMEEAGHPIGTWTLIYQLYPKPIASGADMRYPEDTYSRQTVGGCGIWNADADWARDSTVPLINGTLRTAAQAFVEDFPDMRIVFIDASDAFAGHELCNRNVFRVQTNTVQDRGGVSNWRRSGAADASEWVKEIEVVPSGDATLDEGFHPNYWGQLALRNCLRKVWNGGDITTGGKCTPQRGLNGRGEPNMKFTPMRELTLL